MASCLSERQEEGASPGLVPCCSPLCLPTPQALVNLAKIQHEGIQRDVVATLAHFSANGDMQVDVFPADIFMTLFDLAYSEEQLTARYALMAICNLAVVGMNQVQCVCVCTPSPCNCC